MCVRNTSQRDERKESFEKVREKKQSDWPPSGPWEETEDISWSVLNLLPVLVPKSVQAPFQPRHRTGTRQQQPI